MRLICLLLCLIDGTLFCNKIVGALRASHRVKQKKAVHGLLLRLSGKRDSNPRFAWVLSRELYLHPQPLKGEYWDRFVRTIVFLNKKAVHLDCFFVERKTRLELATPTLARLCSTN